MRGRNAFLAAFASLRAHFSNAFFRLHHLTRTALVLEFFFVVFQRNCARCRVIFCSLPVFVVVVVVVQSRSVLLFDPLSDCFIYKHLLFC